MHDALGDHWVVVGRNSVSFFDTSVDTDLAWNLHRFPEHIDSATLRQELLIGSLCVDSCLKRVTNQWDVALAQNRQLLSSSYSDLPLNQVKPGNHLSDWVLDLQSSVHLHEIVLVSVRIEDKLDCARIVITNGLRRSNRSFTHLRSQICRNARWRLLNDLLMAALNGAVTLIHVHVVTVLVTEDLYLNVARMLDILFNDHVIVIKALLCLSLGSVELVHELLLVPHDPHSFAATAKRCFKHDWEANFAGMLQEDLGAGILPVVSLENRHTRLFHDALTLAL